MEHNPRIRSNGHPPLGQLDHDENMICEIHRHPIGLISLYAGALFALLLVFVGLILVLPTISQLDAGVVPVIIGALIFVGIFMLLGLYVATVVYRESRLVVTNKNITQTLQKSLFNRKISQLSMANVEDVSAEQKGFLQSILDYGTLYIETAGEQENFHFIYTPHPTTIAKEILEAREKFIEQPRGPVAEYYRQPPPYQQTPPNQSNQTSQPNQQMPQQYGQYGEPAQQEQR